MADDEVQIVEVRHNPLVPPGYNLYPNAIRGQRARWLKNKAKYRGLKRKMRRQYQHHPLPDYDIVQEAPRTTVADFLQANEALEEEIRRVEALLVAKGPV